MTQRSSISRTATVSSPRCGREDWRGSMSTPKGTPRIASVEPFASLSPPHRCHPTSAFPESIHIIAPMVHHLTALAEIPSTVIGRAHRIALFMRKLALNYVWAETNFIYRGGGYRSEAVNRRAAVIAHAVQRIKHCVVAHIPFPRGRGEQKRVCLRARQRPQSSKE